MSKHKHPFEQAHSIGPKMVDYLYRINVRTFDDLVNCDAHDLALRIDVEVGGKRLNVMGVRALENLIRLAKDEQFDA